MAFKQISCTEIFAQVAFYKNYSPFQQENIYFVVVCMILALSTFTLPDISFYIYPYTYGDIS